MSSLDVIQGDVIACHRCPELRAYCADVAAKPRRSFAGQRYWGKPVPAFGDATAPIVIVGLAPAAHGANRTGRMFTGDRSGDFLYAALHRAGLASQAESVTPGDGLSLRGVLITAAVRCAPPANKPTAQQRANCSSHLLNELDLMRAPVTLCLGGIGWDAAVRTLQRLDQPVPRPRPRFAHGAECAVGFTTLLGSYHVSQQNTFTGRLTESMFDAVVQRAIELADARP